MPIVLTKLPKGLLLARVVAAALDCMNSPHFCTDPSVYSSANAIPIPQYGNAKHGDPSSWRRLTMQISLVIYSCVRTAARLFPT